MKFKTLIIKAIYSFIIKLTALCESWHLLAGCRGGKRIRIQISTIRKKITSIIITSVKIYKSYSPPAIFSTVKENLRQFVLEYSDKSEEYVGHIT